MSEVTTVVTGWGVTFIVVATYAMWVVLRGKTIGQELGIGEMKQADPRNDAGATTDS
jgi:hypothetical protein